MAKFSRDKGARIERELVHELSKAGFTALRVPLSGAAKGFEYDVIAAKDGRNFSFEVKARATAFKDLYTFYDLKADNGVVAYEGDNNTLFYMSNDLEKLINLKDCVALHRPQEDKKTLRLINKVVRMKEWTKGANFLALRGDRMGFLYVRYFG